MSTDGTRCAGSLYFPRDGEMLSDYMRGRPERAVCNSVHDCVLVDYRTVLYVVPFIMFMSSHSQSMSKHE